MKVLRYRDRRDRVHRVPRDKYLRPAITIGFSSTICSFAKLRPPEPQSQRETVCKAHNGMRETQSSKEKNQFWFLFFRFVYSIFFFGLMLLFSSFSLLILWIILGFSFLSSYFFFSLQPFYGSFCWKVELQLLLKTVSISNRKNLGILE